MSLTDDQKSLLRKALAHAQNPDDAQILCIYLIHHAEWHRLQLALDFLHDIHRPAGPTLAHILAERRGLHLVDEPEVHPNE